MRYSTGIVLSILRNFSLSANWFANPTEKSTSPDLPLSRLNTPSTTLNDSSPAAKVPVVSEYKMSSSSSLRIFFAACPSKVFSIPSPFTAWRISSSWISIFPMNSLVMSVIVSVFALYALSSATATSCPPGCKNRPPERIRPILSFARSIFTTRTLLSNTDLSTMRSTKSEASWEERWMSGEPFALVSKAFWSCSYFFIK